jgi:hypothetical protein
MSFFNHDRKLNYGILKVTLGLEYYTSEVRYGRMRPTKTQRAVQRCTLADYR